VSGAVEIPPRIAQTCDNPDSGQEIALHRW
jgi:hypothetical protein